MRTTSQAHAAGPAPRARARGRQPSVASEQDAESVDRIAVTDELIDELTAWTPRDRLRMLGAWHQSGISLAHLNVVPLLEMNGPMSMGRVAELLGVSVASATGIVDRMEERSLVER